MNRLIDNEIVRCLSAHPTPWYLKIYRNNEFILSDPRGVKFSQEEKFDISHRLNGEIYSKLTLTQSQYSLNRLLVKICAS